MAFGLTKSTGEEADKDHMAMTDDINSMLSECQEILDTEMIDEKVLRVVTLSYYGCCKVQYSVYLGNACIFMILYGLGSKI